MKDETAAYERWLASRNLRGSVVLRGATTATPCTSVVDGKIKE